MKAVRSYVLGSLALGVALGFAPAAQACGGCFHPPSPTAIQVVTDHRMVFSVSDTRTILWDQFSFSGRSEEFTWILPIRDGANARVELSDPRFMQALDNLTAPRVQAAPPVPTRFCGSGDSFGLFGSSASSAFERAGGAFDAGVNVLRQEVVGPYDQATIRGTDPNAIRDWLRNNGYFVPPSIDPILDHYVALRLDFVALKLRPGTGVNQMQPVRVTIPGSNPTLPLRMISAGVGDKVGLLLMVIAPSRMEAMSWPNGELRDTDLVYDYNAPSTDTAADFLRAFRALNARNDERLWLSESSQVLSVFAVSNVVRNIQGTRPTTMVEDDAQRAFEGIGNDANVTRLRAELGARALDRDLQLQASDLGLRDPLYRYGTLRNRPPEPLPCGAVEYKGCSATPGVRGSALSFAALAALAAVVMRRRARRGGAR
jgi:hypothetical protein